MALSGLALYGFHRLWVLYHWYREKKKDNQDPSKASALLPDICPFVTVQLPIYNERFVALRLLDAAAALEWPRDKLEIQVLDDSTDDTGHIVDERSAFWSDEGVTMNVIRRSHRQGYKAGALDHGMKICRGEFIAVFDADFVPYHDFLVRTMPHFADEKVGMVQARWSFLNAEHSWLTAIQSLLLGPHFSIEHWVRWKRGLFFNFNGTAGIWRRKAIETAGGWKADTVTEDLDLSYRAQLAGWRFRYLDDVDVPSELPVTIASFRSQQQRWAKGSIQTAKKILPYLLRTDLPPAIKFEAMAHLLANAGWLLAFIVTLTLYPTILSRTSIGPHEILRIDAPLFIFSSLAILLYFVLFRLTQRDRVPLRCLLALPIFSIGLAPSIALSVLQGFFQRGGVFDRTPKFGVNGRGKLPALASIYRQRSLPSLIMNTVLLAYTVLPVLYALERNTWLAIPFLLVFPLGFLLVLREDVMELLAVPE